MSDLIEFVGRFYCNRSGTIRIRVLSLNADLFEVECVATDGTFAVGQTWFVAVDEFFGGWNQEVPL